MARDSSFWNEYPIYLNTVALLTDKEKAILKA